MTRLKEVLDEQGRKGTWLATTACVTPGTAYNWISGRTKPDDLRKTIISKALGKSVQELFFSGGDE
jgi:hypothetical protein